MVTGIKLYLSDKAHRVLDRYQGTAEWETD